MRCQILCLDGQCYIGQAFNHLSRQKSNYFEGIIFLQDLEYDTDPCPFAETLRFAGGERCFAVGKPPVVLLFRHILCDFVCPAESFQGNVAWVVEERFVGITARGDDGEKRLDVPR